jgi:D-glycero-alpha-D-manno-heptose-7-phosphate kinase
MANENLSHFVKNIRSVRARTPLRLSFGGGGTDVSPYADEFGGCVISATITMYIYATLTPCAEPGLHIRSLDYDSVIHYREEKDFDYNGQMDLAKGVFRRFGAHKQRDGGYELYVHGDAPPGSGLGSSSTFTVTLIGLFRELLGVPMTPYGMAELAYDIERNEIGIKGGRQDQYAAAFGGFNFIEFQKSEVVVTPLRLSPFLIQEMEYSLLLCYTKSVRESQHLINRQIDNFQAGKVDAITALNQIKALSFDLKRTLMLGDLMRFGELLHEGWEQKKLTATGITTPYIDELYEAACKSGAVGGKIAGAGGGGYLLLFVPFQHRHKVTKVLNEMGGQVLDIRFEPNGVQTWRVYE